MPAARPLQRPNWPPYWLQVRSVSNSTAARLTILIPIVGYWIIFNEAVATKLIFDTNATVSWRLFATYFGLCFIAAASGIYQALCPREVKQYSSPTEYIAAVSPHMSDIEEKRVRVRLDAHVATGKLSLFQQSKTTTTLVVRPCEIVLTSCRPISTSAIAAIQGGVALLALATSLAPS
jgi:hypothetical protein